jgi:hypothetical protein
MLKKISSIFLIGLLSLSVCSCVQEEKYNPATYLPEDEYHQFLMKISRYVAKLPKRVTHEQKFDPKYDLYYQQEMQQYKLQHYYISADSTHYFLVNRPAPSLYDKRVAIGGKLKYNKGEITEYEEVFRTWKLKEEELNRKGEVLFAAMVEKGTVDEYLPDNTQEDWVEFPDSRNYFDKDSRRWKIKGQNDSIIYVN